MEPQRPASTPPKKKASSGLTSSDEESLKLTLKKAREKAKKDTSKPEFKEI